MLRHGVALGRAALQDQLGSGNLHHIEDLPRALAGFEQLDHVVLPYGLVAVQDDVLESLDGRRLDRREAAESRL